MTVQAKLAGSMLSTVKFGKSILPHTRASQQLLGVKMKFICDVIECDAGKIMRLNNFGFSLLVGKPKLPGRGCVGIYSKE
jgi:hypothetical protein